MATETESPNRRERRSTNQTDRRHWWEAANRWWTFAIKGVLGLAAILTFAVITNLFYEALFRRSVVIEPISVPKDLEAAGYTPDVAALHLLNAINKYAAHARTSGAGPKLVLHKDEADFVLPNVGLSFKAVVAQIRRFVPIGGSQNISGDITRVDGKLRLRLLKNEVVIHESSEGAAEKNLKALKTLFDDAALGVFAATQPYFEAVANSEKNPEVAFELAKRIIADRPSGEDVVWARNLLGLLLLRRGRLDEKADGAVAEFKRVIHYPSFWDHDPRLAIAHLNLGLAYKEQGEAKSAINEFRSAISIRPELGTAHLKLGDVLDQTGEAEEAGCEYLEAIARFHQDVVSDPFSAAAHQRLGDALKNKEKADKANCAFQDKSIILTDLGRYDDAVAEYQRAAERDPYDAHIRYDLASELLESPDQVDKAIDKLQEALDIRRARNDSFDEFQDQLLKTLSKAMRIKGGNDDEAIRLFDLAVGENEALIEDKPNDDAAAYKRQGVNHYLSRDFEKAVEAHSKAIDIDKTFLAVKIDRGYARFALANERAAGDRAADDFDLAAKDFDDGLHLPQSQADTMIWLYLAREHSRIILGDKYYQPKDHKEELLRNASALLRSNREDWPIKLFLDNQFPEGVLEPEDVLTNVKGTDNQCKAYFYIGEWHALGEERKDAIEWLKKAHAYCPFDFVERSAANAELERLGIASEGVAAVGVSPGISTPQRSSR